MPIKPQARRTYHQIKLEAQKQIAKIILQNNLTHKQTTRAIAAIQLKVARAFLRMYPGVPKSYLASIKDSIGLGDSTDTNVVLFVLIARLAHDHPVAIQGINPDSSALEKFIGRMEVMYPLVDAAFSLPRKADKTQ